MEPLIFESDKFDFFQIQSYFQNVTQNSLYRCQSKSAKWASENLLGINIENDESEIPIIPMIQVPINEYNHILFSQSLINNNEYQRCSNYLLNNGNPRVKSSIGLFLAYYSLYMAGEKMKDQHIQESIVLNTPSLKTVKPNQSNLSNNTSKNPFLNEIYKVLSFLYINNSTIMDGYLIYIFAIVSRDLIKQNGSNNNQSVLQTELYDQLLGPISNSNTNSNINSNTNKKIPEVYDLFLESLRLEPGNWSCWLELTQYCIDTDINTPNIIDFQFLQINKEIEIMYLFFLGNILLEKQIGNESLNIYNYLLNIFTNSTYIITQISLTYYILRDYDQSQQIFENIRQIDSYRLDHIDTYSNILYVKELKIELSYLAHHLMKINRYSAECCCVVGNFYSLKGNLYSTFELSVLFNFDSFNFELLYSLCVCIFYLI